MDKYDYARIETHDIKTHTISVFITIVLEIIFLSFGFLGIFVWNMHFLSAVCLINFFVLPFVLPRNLTILSDFHFYGTTMACERMPFIKHYLNLGLIEVCVFGASFPFLSRMYFVLVAISLPVILGLIMLLIMERYSYSQIHQFLDIDKHFFDNKDEIE